MITHYIIELMSISVCAISGLPLVHAVVSSKSGHIFQKSTITKHLNSFPYCPITKQPLSHQDLIEVYSKNTNVNATTTSIPSLIDKLNSEYDNLVLEAFYLKKHLLETREELSHSLYQHDASVRVIAKLIVQRDQGRSEVAKLNLKIQEIQQQLQQKARQLQTNDM